MDQILEELKGDFLQDCREKLNLLEEILAALDGGGSDFDEAFFELKRHVHSIKGNAGSFGFSSISHLAHSLEDYIGTGGDPVSLSWLAIGKYVGAMSDIVDNGSDLEENETLKIIKEMPSHVQDPAEEDHYHATALVHIPEKVWQNIINQEMKKRGIRVAVAASAVEAIDRGVMLQPEILVTSMQLNRMTGLELATIFQTLKTTTDTKVLVLAASKQDVLDQMEKPDNMVFLEKGADYGAGLSRWLESLSL